MLNPIMKILILLITLSSTVHAADCTSPSAPEGTLQWFSASSVVKFCDGTNWLDTSHGSLGSCAGTTAGTINWSGTVMQFCDGTNWISMKNNSANVGTCSQAGQMSYNPGSNKYTSCDGTNLWDMSPGTICTQVVRTTTGGSTWTVPAHWNNASNTIQIIGAGGGGGTNGSTSGGAGGGAGAFAKVSNVTLTGATVYHRIAAGGAASTSGGDTYLCASQATDCGTGGAVVWAKGGGGASGLTAGTGAAASGTGSLQKAGGSGYLHAGSSNKGSGGGGAGGGVGDGLAATSQVGGKGDAGSGGAGGTANNAGAAGTESGTAGSGGGGGGGNINNVGGVGGAYGGGGGGGGKSRAGGAGGQGVIIINYTSTTTCP